MKVLHQVLKNKRLLFYVVGFSTICTLLVYQFDNLYSTYKEDITNEVGNRQLLTARTLANNLEEVIYSIVDELNESAKLVDSSSDDAMSAADRVEFIFEEYQSNDTPGKDSPNCGIISIRWFSPTGEERFRIPMNDDPLSPPELVRMTVRSLEWREDETFRFIGPYLSPKGIHTLWLLVPIHDQNIDGSLGAIGAEINLERFFHHFFTANLAKGESDFFIIDRQGYIIHCANHPEMFMVNVQGHEQRCNQCHQSLDFPRRMLREIEGWGYWTTPTRTVLDAFAPIEFENNLWIVSLGLPKQSLVDLIGHFHYRYYGLIVLLFGLFFLTTSILVDLRKKWLTAEERAKYLQQRTALLREKKEMDQRYIELVEKANDAIYILQEDRFILVNRAFEKLHGYSREELLSPDFNLMNIIAPKYRDYIIERGERSAKGESLEPTYEFKILRKDGKEIDVEVSVTYIRYGGKPAVQGIIRDISDRKRQEEQNALMLSLSNTVRDSTDFNDLAVKALECVMTILSVSHGALYVFNEKKNELQLIAHKGIQEEILPFLKVYKMSEEERGVAAKTALRQEIISVEDIAASPLLSYIPDQMNRRGESLISIPLISQNMLLGVLQLVKDSCGRDGWSENFSNLQQMANAIAIGLHRRRISSELTESERRLKHFFENSQEVIYSTTPDGVIREINKAGIQFFDFPKEGDSNDVRVDRYWRSKSLREEFLARLKREGFVKEMEVDYLCKDGKVRTFLESAVAMRDENGKIIEFQGIMWEITALKQAEEEMRRKNIELEKANEELRKLDKMKDSFISTVSHELRTPLTSIKGSLDILTKGMVGELDEKQLKMLTICQRNTRRLIDLVQDLLEIQRLESERTQLHLKPIHMGQLVAEVVEKVNNECNNKGIRLQKRIHTASQGRVVLADQSKITHALFNLLSNAIKFSDRGTVLVELEYRNGEMRLSVSDEGIGIPEEMKDKIFDKFTQADDSMTRERGGTGLGLAITQKIVEKHGGRIWVESRKGAGSIFTFCIPCRPPDHDGQEKE